MADKQPKRISLTTLQRGHLYSEYNQAHWLSIKADADAGEDEITEEQQLLRDEMEVRGGRLTVTPYLYGFVLQVLERLEYGEKDGQWTSMLGLKRKLETALGPEAVKQARTDRAKTLAELFAPAPEEQR